MKIRQGFVSNSSSSSFLVEYKNVFEPTKIQLSDDKVKKLEDFGFWKTDVYYPDQVNWSDKNKFNVDSYNYGYDILCNEWEVLEFLITNKIPFKSLCHYEHFYIQYDGRDSITVARNFGKEIMMYEYDINEYKNVVPVWEITTKKFLKYGSYRREIS